MDKLGVSLKILLRILLSSNTKDFDFQFGNKFCSNHSAKV